jgi:hypothetical protein
MVGMMIRDLKECKELVVEILIVNIALGKRGKRRYLYTSLANHQEQRIKLWQISWPPTSAAR